MSGDRPDTTPMPTVREAVEAEASAVMRDARRWRQIDYICGAVVTVRGSRISNNVLPLSQLGRLLDEDATNA